MSLRPKEELDHIKELYKDYDKRWIEFTSINHSFTPIGWQHCAIFCIKMTSRPATQGLRHNLRLRRRRKSILNLSRWPCQWKINAQLENMLNVQETFNIHAVQINEEENARVAKRRADRLLREAEERRWVLFVVLNLWESPMRLGGWFFVWSSLSTLQKWITRCPEFLGFPHSYLNMTPRLKIKADLEEARIEEDERLKVIDRWEQGSIRIDGEKMHLLCRQQIPWWKQSLQRWNRELKKKRWDAMYL